jgi:MvaI/BcnI restriction endonuclease family
MARPDRGLNSVLRQFRSLAVNRVLVKELAPNDNSKNQVYVGRGFESLNLIPVRKVSTKEPARSNEKRINFKAKLDWSWLIGQSHITAPRAQLILYPAYPEVRISGFLEDCSVDSETAQLMGGRSSGRVLLLGIADGGKIYSYVGNRNSKMVEHWKELKQKQSDWKLEWRSSTDWALREVPLSRGRAGFYRMEFVEGRLESGTIREVLERLQEIHRHGWHPASRLNASGTPVQSQGQNAGGTTLESLFGIASNAKKDPDYKGWELKNIDAASDRVTLITPEPKGGIYGEKGVAKFVQRFGYVDKKNKKRMNFASPHYASKRNEKTKLTLGIEGYSHKKLRITNNDGGIVLRTTSGRVAAKWNFTDLMYDWNHKHAQVVFVPSSSTHLGGKQYVYLQSVTVAEQSDFLKFLRALSQRWVYFDPGTNVLFIGRRTRVHPRSQFRAKSDDLHKLYQLFRPVNICEPLRIRAKRAT